VEEKYHGCKKDRRSNHSLKLIAEQDTFNVISAYTPQAGLEKHLKEEI